MCKYLVLFEHAGGKLYSFSSLRAATARARQMNKDTKLPVLVIKITKKNKKIVARFDS